MSKWIQGAVKPENKGKFTASAKKAGKSVAGYAKTVLKSDNSSTLQKRRAVFAENMQAIARKRMEAKSKE